MLNLSYALNYAIGGERVFGYHVVNLTVHALAGLALFGVVRRTLNSTRLRERFSGAAGYLAAVVALLWTVHPLQTESVDYLSQRAEGLMGLFYLLTLLCFLRARDDPPASAKWRMASIGCCWLGMATKEGMVTAPFVVFAFDSIFVAGTLPEAWRARRSYYVGLATSWLFLAWLMLAFSKRSVGFHQGIGVGTYALTECRAIVRYLGLSLWPHPLVFDYGPVFASGALEVWPWAIVLLLALGATAVALVHAPAVGFLGLWFFVLLSPTSSFVPVALQPVAESRMYLPLAAIVAGAVLAAHGLLGARLRWLIPLIAIASIVGTFRRNKDYREPLSLWNDTVAKCPENPRAHDHLGNALVHAGRMGEAIDQYRRAIGLAPEISRIHYNLAKALHDTGRPAEAIQEYEAALRLEPNYADAHINLGNMLFALGRPVDAQRNIERALQLEPEDSRSRTLLGVIDLELGETAQARDQFMNALRINPAEPEAHLRLGNILAASGDLPSAIVHWQSSLRIRPDDPEAHNNYATALAQTGRTEEAIEHYEAALRLKPDYAQARANLEDLLAQRKAAAGGK